MFTAAAVFRLAMQHRLRLSDKVSAYLPRYRYGNMITIRELLQQTSGLPDLTTVDPGLKAETKWGQMLGALNKLALR